MIDFRCDECGETYKVDDALAGKAIRCRNCNEFGRVPASAVAESPRQTKSSSVQPNKALADREPWFYWFLASLARVLMVLGLLLWTAERLVLAVVLSRAAKREEASGGISIMPLSELFLSYLLGVAVILIVPAFILLTVDAARNLRAIRTG